MNVYRCPVLPTCRRRVPADTSGCVCAKPASEQKKLEDIQNLADWGERRRQALIDKQNGERLQQILDQLEVELTAEVSKQFPSAERLARIERLNQEVRA